MSETGRNDRDPVARLVAVASAVAARGFAYDPAEFLGEMALIREAALGGHCRDRASRKDQRVTAHPHPELPHVGVRRAQIRISELAMKRTQ